MKLIKMVTSRSRGKKILELHLPKESLQDPR